MIGRRAFMAALGLAPVASVAGQSAGYNNVAAVSNGVGFCPTEDPLLTSAHRYLRRKQERLHDRMHKSSDHMPPKYASKKSWSPAFKIHAWEQDARQNQDLHRLYDLDPQAVIELAMKMGWQK